MHANGMINDTRTTPVHYADLVTGRAASLDLVPRRTNGTHDPAHAMDHFYCPTLMEHIMDFLERYNQSPCGQQ
jgi:hypothetical protein